MEFNKNSNKVVARYCVLFSFEPLGQYFIRSRGDDVSAPYRRTRGKSFKGVPSGP